MDISPDGRVATVAARQHGVFTYQHAAAAGIGARQREVRVRTGRWVLRAPGVYSIAGAPESWRGSVLAACWAAHGLAVASHRSAAELWGLPGGRRDIMEITCRRSRRAKSPGLVVHETKLLKDVDMQTIDGIPTTSIEQTLLGLAAVVLESTVEMALDRALNRKLTTIARLEAFVRRKGKRGRNGIGVLRSLVGELDPLAGVPESAMETKLKQLLRRHGLPMPRFQYEIRHNGRVIARVDAAYPEHRIAIEYDSYEHHTGKLAIVRDNDRRNRISDIQWRPVVFTAADLVRDGGPALRTLRTYLASGATRSS